jgi:hypothetical protein
MQVLVKELKRLHELLPKIKLDNNDDTENDEDVHEVHNDINEGGEKGMMEESGGREIKDMPRNDKL